MEEKPNCWEFKGCGREPGGAKVAGEGVCPAASETFLSGTNGGKNAGRVCWSVAGTMCGDEPQGTFVQKYHNCARCDFYHLVTTQEGGNFRMV